MTAGRSATQPFRLAPVTAVAAALLACMASPSARAQPDSAPAVEAESTGTSVAALGPTDSPDALLMHVRALRDRERARIEALIADYRAASAEDQAAMLRSAESRHGAIDDAVGATVDVFSANEVRINELNRELLAEAAALGVEQVSVLARQAAGEAAVVLQQSLITSQYPTAAESTSSRERFLRELAAARRLPTIRELEQLWYELQREITASGEVVVFRTGIAEPDGREVESDVVRIGPFTATAQGRFLAYLPELGALRMLPRQPPAHFTEAAHAFEQAGPGFSPAVVDPTRGVLLDLYVERPSVLERIEHGETVGYVIIAVGLAGLVMFVIQLISLLGVRFRIARQLERLDTPVPDNPLGRVLLAFKGDISRIDDEAEVAELRISEAVLHEVPRLERFQSFLRLAVAAGPLLGLIGTVIGMIVTFQSITEAGSSDPRLMATGIGQAMIATVLGLGIAIPLLFANALLASLSRGVVQILDQQSAGMLAESIEKRLHA